MQIGISQIPQTQFRAQPPQDRKQDNVRREFKGVEGCANSFMSQRSSFNFIFRG